jgi:ABC-2 type transport system permease protein
MTPFSATLRSEWTKLVTLRSTTWLVVLGLVLSVGLSALIALVAGVTWQDWDAAERSSFEPIGFALIGGIPSALLYVALGAKAATSEYGAGMIRLTFTATPRRGRVLAAKALVVAAVTLFAGLVLNVGMVVVAQAIFAAYGIESRSLGDGDVLRAVLVGGALSPLFPVIALALGFVARSTAAAVIGVFVLIFAPPFLGGVLPRWWDQHVLALAPGPASDAVAVGHLEGVTTPLSAGAGLLLVIAWTALFLGGAWALLERRDA